MRGFFNENLTYGGEAEHKLEGRINPEQPTLSEAKGRASKGLFSRKSKNPFSIFLCRFLVCTLSISLVLMPSAAQAQSINLLNLPIPGTMVSPSPAFVPVLLKGMTIHPDDPLRFDFIVDSGNTDFTTDEIKQESERLVKYFLASMTVPKDDLWVNLSPYESDRIIPEELGKTELGRDMLAQDYILKQLTASLMYPEEELGKEFWERIYERAEKEYGTTEIPVNTFNKVWILPEQATVYEHEQTVYVVDARLKVMLDADYVAMQQDLSPETSVPETQNLGDAGTLGTGDAGGKYATTNMQSEIIREIILPAIEKEVNEGAHFAPLRQIYHSLILAKWYKETIKNSLLSQVYVDKNLTDGVNVEDETIKDQIYAQYMEAYKKGVFNYIKEDYVAMDFQKKSTATSRAPARDDRLSNEVIPRKYFSGGMLIGAGDIAVADSPVSVYGLPDKGQLLAEVRVRGQKNGKTAASPILGGPWTLKGARNVLNNPGRYSEKQLITGINKIGRSDDKESGDIELLREMLQTKSLSVRQVAEKYLTDWYVNELSHKDAKVRRKAIRWLVEQNKQKDPKVVEMLLKVLGDSDYQIRAIANEALKELSISPVRLAEGYLVASLSHSLDASNEAIKNLSELVTTDREKISSIISFAQSGSYSIGQIESALSRNRLNENSVIRKFLLIIELVSQVDSEYYKFIDEVIINRLADYKMSKTPYTIKPISEDKWEVVQVGVTEVKGAPIGYEFIEHGVGDYTIGGDPIYESRKVSSIPKGISIEKVYYDQSSPVNKEDGDKDGASSPILGRPWTLEGARVLLDNSEKYSQKQIIKAINMVGNVSDKGNKDIERLKRMLYYADYEAQKETEKHLTSEQIFDGYVLALESESAWSRWVAAEKLGALGDRRAVKPLFRALSHEHDLSAKSSIAKSLQKFGLSSQQRDEVAQMMFRAVNKNYNIFSNLLHALGDSRGHSIYIYHPQDGHYIKIENGTGSGVWVDDYVLDQEAYWEGPILRNQTSSPLSLEDQPGGIDMNQIDVDRQGAGVDIQFDPIAVQEIIDMGITGFSPVIINLTPLPSVLPLLGLAPQREEYEVSSLN